MSKEFLNRRVLNLSIDSKLFEKGSSVAGRFIEYGKSCDEIHVVIYTKKGFRNIKLSDNVYLYPTNSVNKSFYFIDALRLAKRIITKDTFVTSQEAFTHILGIFLKKRFGICLELQYHTDFLSPYFRRESIKNYIRYKVYLWSIKYADSIRVVSEKMRREVEIRIRKPGLKISVEPIKIDSQKIINTIPSFYLHKKYPQFEKIILMVSRLEAEKNIAFSIDVFSEIHKKFPKTGLVIVGDGSLRASLRFRAYSYNLGNNIVFEGWQSDTISYYKTADIFLNTSWYEGYGVSIIEAALSQCPIVTSQVGIAEEIFVDGISARMCAVNDAVCIEGALLDLLTDPSQRNMLKKNAFEKVASSLLSHGRYLEEYKKACYTIQTA